MKIPLGILAIVAVIPEITAFSRHGFLKALHAILYSWDDLIQAASKLISQLFHIPDLPPFLMHALIYYSIFFIPLMHIVIEGPNQPATQVSYVIGSPSGCQACRFGQGTCAKDGRSHFQLQQDPH